MGINSCEKSFHDVHHDKDTVFLSRLDAEMLAFQFHTMTNANEI